MPRLPFPPCTTFFFFLSSISIGKIGILGDLLTSCLFMYLLYQLAGNQIIFHLLFCKCIIYFQGRETQSFIVATPPKNCLYDYVVYNSIQYPGDGAPRISIQGRRELPNFQNLAVIYFHDMYLHKKIGQSLWISPEIPFDWNFLKIGSVIIYSFVSDSPNFQVCWLVPFPSCPTALTKNNIWYG